MNQTTPELALPEKVKKGDTVEVKVRINHAMKSQEYLQKLMVYYGGTLVFQYAMTPGVSDDPRVSFFLKAARSSEVKAVFIDNKGRKFEAVKTLHVEN
ncbi:MAG: thiosulfate oxidation carrier complex protein SoxZ [Nitrospirae bacterium]|nr:thiosulfate oxidation carrier complex protein SoxZ [Nitrospirota bacterium]MCL5238405.1 thiosulfate oxidation carrier complex protein SoxZ [Nitrospirota bacterium]